MAYGFSCENDAGEIQIDQDYYCPRLFKEGSKNAVRTAAGAYQAMRISWSPTRSQPPLVAVSPGTGVDCTMAVAQVATDYGSLVFHHGQNIGTTHSVDYALYDADGGIASNTAWGMKVFNASGGTVFDSRNAYLNVVDIVSVAYPGTGITANVTYNHTSLANAFYVVNALNGIVIVPNAGTGLILARGVRQKTISSLQIKHSPIGLASGVDVGVDTRTATEILVCQKIPI